MLTDLVYKHFLDSFKGALAARKNHAIRIGSELKFPLVKRNGHAVEFETICALWKYLQERAWEPIKDVMTGRVVGARRSGKENDTVASCETGFCKPEFSLAHVGNLFELDRAIRDLRRELQTFSEKNDAHFLGYGIQPLTFPSKRLLMKQGRTSVWKKVFTSNKHISEEDGDDLHLFTINSASHVHIDVDLKEAIPAVNVLNGFAGAQIALTANSNIWRGQIDPQYKCVAEKFWDWWMPDANRVGIPCRPFADLKDYVRTIADLRPVYVERLGKPIVPRGYSSFGQYYHTGRVVGIDSEGREVSFVPDKSDIDLHSTCYWYNARITRYYTVENRVNDQQPPEDLVCIAALTLGLMSALAEANEELSSWDWNDLRASRDSACRQALQGKVGKKNIVELVKKMLELAQMGLRRRGLGEEEFLVPFETRLRELKCPADEAAQLFKDSGIDALINARRL